MSQAIMQRQTTKGPSAWEVTLANTKLWLKSPTPYLNALGLVAFVLFWYLTTEYFQLPYFEKLPGPVASFQEWVSKDPVYGISIYTSDYYAHIGISVWRVFQPSCSPRSSACPPACSWAGTRRSRTTHSRCSKPCAPSPCWHGPAGDPDVARP